MEQFNISAFLFINQYAGKNKIVDNILISAVEIIPYLFILVLICLWLSSDDERKKSSLHAGLAALLGMLTSNVISSFYYHPRPFVKNLGSQLIEHAADSSFPSDHTTFVFSIAVMLLFNKATRVVGGALCIFSFISSLSRVFGGVHFPIDILGGILVAIFSSTVMFILSRKQIRPIYR